MKRILLGLLCVLLFASCQKEIHGYIKSYDGIPSGLHIRFFIGNTGKDVRTISVPVRNNGEYDFHVQPSVGQIQYAGYIFSINAKQANDFALFPVDDGVKKVLNKNTELEDIYYQKRDMDFTFKQEDTSLILAWKSGSAWAVIYKIQIYNRDGKISNELYLKGNSITIKNGRKRTSPFGDISQLNLVDPIYTIGEPLNINDVSRLVLSMLYFSPKTGVKTILETELSKGQAPIE